MLGVTYMNNLRRSFVNRHTSCLELGLSSLMKILSNIFTLITLSHKCFCEQYTSNNISDNTARTLVLASYRKNKQLV